MAIVVIFSTISFTANMHYCGAELIDTAFFKDAKTCGMETNIISDIPGCTITQKNCCSEKTIVIDGQDELKTSLTKLTLEQQLFVEAFTYTYINLFKELEIQTIPFKEYSPPFLVTDIQVINDSFII